MMRKPVPIDDYYRLTKKEKWYADACAVLGEILREHRELQGCVTAISSHILDKLKEIDDEMKVAGRTGQ